MLSAIDYLEAAKIEELAAELEAKGYKVFRSAPIDGIEYDLVASRKDRKIAIEVKAQSSLKENALKLVELRDKAHQNGFDEFQLVVVNPPHQTDVKVSGLQSELLQYLINHRPGELDNLFNGGQVTKVYQTKIDSIDISDRGIRVAGGGTLEVEYKFMDEATGERKPGRDVLPLQFDVLLNHELKLLDAYQLKIDTSGLTE